MLSMLAMASTEGLRRLLARQDLTMEELVEQADALVKELAPKQTRYKVTERPDARTIRYYVSQNLLPKPLGYEGGRARYGGTHLLRLLLIKRMQAEHHTLSRIAHVLEDATEEQIVEALLGGREPEPAHPELPARIQSATPPRMAAAALARTEAPAPAQAGRVELAPGAALEVPDEVLRDRAQRERLADSLEALARWLRAAGGGKGEDA